MSDAPCNVVVVSGSPRSGTSWLGQILDSSLQTCYRYQPLFSHRFKDAVDENSAPDEVGAFFKMVYASEDPFLCQKARRKQGIYPTFSRNKEIEDTLVIKMVRYQHLLRGWLQAFPDIRMICLVRHPCGVLNSWLSAPKEFPAGAEPLTEWKEAPSRNVSAVENVWGYYAWERIAKSYLSLAEEFPESVRVQRFEDLVENPIEQTGAVFEFCGVPFQEATRRFLKESSSVEDADPYSVYKNGRKVRDRWRHELEPLIADSAIALARRAGLERFL